MVRTATLVELTVYERLLPLVSGYLEAYSRKDARLDAGYRFKKYAAPVTTSRDRLLADLSCLDSDVYAFSCYVWNMGLVSWLIKRLVSEKSEARFILGGPQVIDHAASYVRPEDENVAVCNNEGERTFASYLGELLEKDPDLRRVRGLSFYRAGTLVTTPKEEKIEDLDEIPSPFLGGLFEADTYTYAVYETNRGCPYRCSFCYWGLGDPRVSKFSDDRVLKELTWLCDNGYLGILTADANWGIFQRDVEFSRHLVACKKRTDLPYIIGIQSAKNNPGRLVEIAEIFQSAGILTTQSIGIQSMDDEVLIQAGRKNIKVEAYETTLKKMNEASLASYIELIWPLPGETLETFREGVNRLCGMKAQSFIPHQLMLLNNTEMARQRDKLGLVTIKDSDGVGESELVIATSEVDENENKDGLWFCLAVLALYNARGLYCVLHHLNDVGIASYADVFSRFAEFGRRRTGHPLIEYYATSLEKLTYCKASHWGRTLHLVTHECREEFDELLHDFVKSQPWWDGATRRLFELDLLNKLYAYKNTPIRDTRYPFEFLSVQRRPDGYQVRVPADCLPFLTKYVEVLEPNRNGCTDYFVRYRRNQMPFMATETIEHNANYCHAVMENVRSCMPSWTGSSP